MTKMHLKYSAILADMMGGTEYQIWIKQGLGRLEINEEVFKTLLIETFAEQGDTGLCSLKYPYIICWNIDVYLPLYR